MSRSIHNARGEDFSAELIGCRWRVGGSIGRTIYAIGSYEEAVIGLVDSQELAAHIVDVHNARVDGLDGGSQ